MIKAWILVLAVYSLFDKKLIIWNVAMGYKTNNSMSLVTHIKKMQIIVVKNHAVKSNCMPICISRAWCKTIITRVLR